MSKSTATGRKLTIDAGDAGQLIDGLFNFQSIKGGKLHLVASLPGRASDPEVGAGVADYQGTLDIDDFQVVNQPLLARLFSAGSLTGIGDLMGGDGISVENLNVPFSSKNNVISVHDARARGRAIGATADGYIDRPQEQDRAEGLAGARLRLEFGAGQYSAAGRCAGRRKKARAYSASLIRRPATPISPRSDVNPLSVLTPGICAAYSRAICPTAANAPSNAPAAAPKPPSPAELELA